MKLEKVQRQRKELEPSIADLEEGDALILSKKSDVLIRTDGCFHKLYTCSDVLGKGKFGVVKKCVDKATGVAYAAKFVQKTPESKKDVVREVEMMNLLHHKRLIQLYNAFETPKEMIVVMELVTGGELFEKVVEEDNLTEKQVVRYMRQVLYGVQHMHNKNMIHLDLKPENILCVDGKPGYEELKLIDFGMTRQIQPGVVETAACGTPEFVAPEVISFRPISTAADMWSIGVITYVLLSGLSPFMGENDFDTLKNVASGEYDFDDDDNIFESISEDAKNFIRELLLLDPKKRNTVDDCLNHKWFRKGDEISGKKLKVNNLRKYLVRKRWAKAIKVILATNRFARGTFGEHWGNRKSESENDVCDGKNHLKEEESRARVTAEKTIAEEKQKLDEAMENQKRAAAEENRKHAEAEEKRKHAEAEEKRKRAEAEEKRVQAAAEEKRKRAEAEEKRVQAAAEEKRKRAEAEEKRKRAEAEEKRVQAAAEEKRKQAAAEENRKHAEAEEMRKRAEADEKRKQAEAREKQKLAAAEENRKRAEAEDKRKQAAAEEKQKQAEEKERQAEAELKRKQTEAASNLRLGESEGNRKQFEVDRKRNFVAAKIPFKQSEAENQRKNTQAEEKRKPADAEDQRKQDQSEKNRKQDAPEEQRKQAQVDEKQNVLPADERQTERMAGEATAEAKLKTTETEENEKPVSKQERKAFGREGRKDVEHEVGQSGVEVENDRRHVDRRRAEDRMKREEESKKVKEEESKRKEEEHLKRREENKRRREDERQQKEKAEEEKLLRDKDEAKRRQKHDEEVRRKEEEDRLRREVEQRQQEEAIANEKRLREEEETRKRELEALKLREELERREREEELAKQLEEEKLRKQRQIHQEQSATKQGSASWREGLKLKKEQEFAAREAARKERETKREDERKQREQERLLKRLKERTKSEEERLGGNCAKECVDPADMRPVYPRLVVQLQAVSAHAGRVEHAARIGNGKDADADHGCVQNPEGGATPPDQNHATGTVKNENDFDLSRKSTAVNSNVALPSFSAAPSSDQIPRASLRPSPTSSPKLSPASSPKLRPKLIENPTNCHENARVDANANVVVNGTSEDVHDENNNSMKKTFVRTPRKPVSPVKGQSTSVKNRIAAFQFGDKK